MDAIEMTSTRHLLVAAGVLGVTTIVTTLLLIHGARLTIPWRERVAFVEGRAAVHGELERLETTVPAGRAGHDGLWRAHLDAFEKERSEGHLDVALRILYDAYGAALESRSWESMIAVGDAFISAGRAPGNAAGARMNARQAYLTALIRARRERSVEGALRSGEAFRRLADSDVVEQCLHIAGMLAAGNESAQERVREARTRWAKRQPLGEL
jgi:hypothetical protein